MFLFTAQQSAVASSLMLPWAFKTFFGLLSDSYALFGSYRKSYMILGWLIFSLSNLYLTFLAKPQLTFRNSLSFFQSAP